MFRPEDEEPSVTAEATPKLSMRDKPPLVDRLCPTCSRLNISPEKFVSKRHTENTLSGLLATPFDSVWSQPQDLGYIDDICRRMDSCSLCWLLFHAVHLDEWPLSRTSTGSRYRAAQISRGDVWTDEGTRVRCSVEWLLDGRLLDDPGSGKRHPPPTRRLKVFSPAGLFTDSYIMLMSPKSTSPSTESTFLARQIPYDQANIALLRRWLDICRTNHVSGCRPHQTPHETVELLENLKFIDLENKAVVVSSRSGVRVTEYATLSYVWGLGRQLTLSHETLTEFSSKGSLKLNRPDLPKTVRDAMILVKSLGIRYIWIDSLCIVQNDPSEMQRILPMMDRIYGNSVLNVCAAAGDGSNYGIPGSPASPRAAWQPIVHYAGFELVATKTVEGLIENTAWNSRAWTFQERMLSKRSMIFVENRVFFQCREATWSEEVFSEALASSWTLEMVRSPLKSFEKNPVRLYVEYVELFSGRLLTYEADRLRAFEGISAMLCAPLRASFFYGLPDSYFDFALLWEKKTPGRRLKGIGEDGIPSWSWSAWLDASIWRLSMISGTLLNLHEWLEYHTWVVWSSSQCHPRPSRWHGYARENAESRPFGRRQPPISDDAETKPIKPTTSILKKECLYFWTYTAFFRLSCQSRTGPTFASKLEPGLRRFGLLDAHGDWCGTIILEDEWSDSVGDVVELAAISDARDFSMEELDTWNYYVPEDREASEWRLYYAFLIVWDDSHVIAQRAGLAKVYQRAFELASFEPGKAWREITLG
ncbi:Heterokaryon incompatibility protein [Colletotrichum higginsianum IMI 349063]|uniref:Heterokaryon incompatibility protein n=3 Tax=Colletotrichum higginsianum TaxID=80884 RepID=A0A1B7YIQ0_COLHI|nr:Heterokaryon incompatibility protein [Colletotrichum higginsianum IMI 349063]OBR11875.1 Heterokaryon incompatibility protein [Colletotrichum higginsianum IMI 349063]